MKITDWAEEDRPREKLIQKGKVSLSNAELLAILIGTGTKSLTAVDLAKNILNSTNNNLHELSKLSIHDLKKFKGIGEAKALVLLSALELGRRRKELEPSKQIQITSPENVFEIMHPILMDISHEECWIILLNKANIVINKKRISTGGVDATIVDPKIIFKSAIEELASGIILVHNHPSGNLKPSESDKILTKKIKEAGKLLEINLIDHVIITDTSYFSFADEELV